MATTVPLAGAVNITPGFFIFEERLTFDDPIAFLTASRDAFRRTLRPKWRHDAYLGL
jgi:hypothetical protein